MEDAPLTAQVVMPSVTEDESESGNSHSHSRNPSQVSSYVVVNDDSLVQTPLLETDESNENTHEDDNSNPSIPSRSVDISDLRHNDPSSPPADNPGFADPRGEAPPYFEVVGGPPDLRAASGELSRIDTTDTLPIAPDSPPALRSGTPPARRRSVFRGLIDAASRALSTPHPSAQPVTISRSSRDVAVSPPPRPSNLSNRPAGTRSPLVGHRTTPSNSGSILSVQSSTFGARSRSATNVVGGLTSPSLISIASISAPLTHTAVRTDFVYPRTGPTPEQLKLISSIESVSKFGVPYGPDAVAYASASLVNLHGPPPGFEERPSLDGLPGPSVAATRARARSSLSQDVNAPESRSSFSSPPQSASRVTTVTSASAADEPEAVASSPEPDAPVLSDVASPAELGHSDEKEKPDQDHSVERVPPRPPSPSPTQETTSTTATVINATAPELGAASESPDENATSGGSRPALTVATRNPAAPSSFRMPSAPLGHSHVVSRSSSVDTFCTATSQFEQVRGLGHGTSDTEHETDTFTDAESDAETGAETQPATPHAVSVGSAVLGAEQPGLRV
jgi:hypothetical protein